MNQKPDKPAMEPYKSPFKTRRSSRLTSPQSAGVLVLGGIGIAIAVFMIIGGEPIVRGNKLVTQVPQEIRVIDGDTIDVDGTRIRLYGIDAPERSQPCLRNEEAYDCGTASSEQLTFLLVGERVACETKSTDRWNRAVAICLVNNVDLSQQMVKSGWAVAYAEYSQKYVADEEFAQTNGLGMWAKDFELPKDWRSQKRN